MKSAFAQGDPARPTRRAAIRALAVLLFSARNLAVLMLLCAVAGSGGCSGLGRRPASELIVADPIDHLDSLAREPMVVEHPDGTLFLSGYGASVPTLWRIVDFARAEDARFSSEGGGEDRLPPRRIVLVSPPPALPRGRQARR